MDDEKKPRTVRDVLIAARERIAKPGGWTQRTYARDAAGEPVAPRNRDAACYCAVGAINAAGGGHEACRALRMATGNGGYLDIWNDAPGRTQAEVVAAFDRAIAAQPVTP